MIGYDDVTPQTLDFGDYVGKPWSVWRAAEAGGVSVEVRHTHNMGGRYEARTVDTHDGKSYRATCTGAWQYAASRAANKLVDARKHGSALAAHQNSVESALSHDKAISGEVVPAGSFSPREWRDLTHIPAGARLLLAEITEAARHAAQAVARLCELLHQSRAHWRTTDVDGEWAWRQAIENECGIAAPLAAKMAQAWETVLRYPAWEAALRETRDAWDLEALAATANALREKDPDGELVDDERLGAALTIERRALRQRRVRDLLWELEARRMAGEQPELELDGGASPGDAPGTPAGHDPFIELAEFERDARQFMESVRKIRARLSEHGPMRDRLALMTDRVAGVVDGLAEALGAEDF